MIADLTTVMDGLATAAAGLAPDVYAWPVDSVTVPCLVVGYPTTIEFDITFQRGGDRLVVPLYYLVGKTSTKDARNALSTIIGDGSSVKSAIDAATFADCRVMSAAVEEVTVAGVTFLSVRFDVEVI